MRKALPESQAQSEGESMQAQSFARPWARRLGVVAIAFGVLGSAAGCAVSESDVHRWESTVRGPYKLVAVVTHDKYSLPLRIEAAMSLLRMPPRGGRRMGIAYLCDKYKDDDLNDTDGALASISEDSRKKIVNGLVPLIIAEIQKPPPGKTADGRKADDPSVPFKDAAFAMLSHEPSLVSDPKTKADARRGPESVGADGLRDPGRQQRPAVRRRADHALPGARRAEREVPPGAHHRYVHQGRQDRLPRRRFRRR